MNNTFLLTFIIFICFSCTKEIEIIDTIQGTWTLTHTEGDQGNVSVSIPWNVLEISDYDFQLFAVSEDGSEEELASGVIELCENSIMQNCYRFEIDFKKIGVDFMMEGQRSKIIRLIDGELSLNAPHSAQLSYFFN